ncbi:hypothetical protein [Microbacterium sp.]|uniref:hypothetical protein n=1 Tax=Microbacterium sp. TaxID=51671 RepID=UPI003A849DB2
MNALVAEYVDAALAVAAAGAPDELHSARVNFVGDLWLDTAGRLLQELSPFSRGARAYERYRAWTNLAGVGEHIVDEAMHRAVHTVAQDLSCGPWGDGVRFVVQPYGGWASTQDELRIAAAEAGGQTYVAGFARAPFSEPPHVTMAMDLQDWDRAADRNILDGAVLIERMRAVAARVDELMTWADAVAGSGLVGRGERGSIVAHVRRFTEAVDGADASRVVTALEDLALPLAATRYAVLHEALQQCEVPDEGMVA